MDLKKEIMDRYDKISYKRLLMQYFRLIPAKLGLINKAAFLLQIKKIYPDDIFLLSYPKSGNTWVRFIIAYMQKGLKENISFNDIESIVPDIYIHSSKENIDNLNKNRIIKIHTPFFDEYPRILYIYRDYRDVLVSFYYYTISLNKHNVIFSEFIRSNHINTFGTWKDHVKGAMDCKKKMPEKILMICYESLISEFQATAKRISEFCQIDKEINYLELEKKTSFHALQENEKINGSRFSEKSGTSFIRAGKIGEWNDIFTQEDLNYLYADKELVDIMQALGYNDTL